MQPGLTVQHLIDTLSKLSEFDRTKYVVNDNDDFINCVEEYWIPSKWAGNCIKLSSKNIRPLNKNID